MLSENWTKSLIMFNFFVVFAILIQNEVFGCTTKNFPFNAGCHSTKLCHGKASQTTDVPFEIIAEDKKGQLRTNIFREEEVKLTLRKKSRNGAGMRGFVISAVIPNSVDAVGTFRPVDERDKGIGIDSCTSIDRDKTWKHEFALQNSTVSHRGEFFREQIQVYWKAPTWLRAKYLPTTVSFKGTVIQDVDTFWTDTTLGQLDLDFRSSPDLLVKRQTKKKINDRRYEWL